MSHPAIMPREPGAGPVRCFHCDRPWPMPEDFQALRAHEAAKACTEDPCQFGDDVCWQEGNEVCLAVGLARHQREVQRAVQLRSAAPSLTALARRTEAAEAAVAELGNQVSVLRSQLERAEEAVRVLTARAEGRL